MHVTTHGSKIPNINIKTNITKRTGKKAMLQERGQCPIMWDCGKYTDINKMTADTKLITKPHLDLIDNRLLISLCELESASKINLSSRS